MATPSRLRYASTDVVWPWPELATLEEMLNSDVDRKDAIMLAHYFRLKVLKLEKKVAALTQRITELERENAKKEKEKTVEKIKNEDIDIANFGAGVFRYIRDHLIATGLNIDGHELVKAAFLQRDPMKISILKTNLHFDDTAIDAFNILYNDNYNRNHQTHRINVFTADYKDTRLMNKILNDFEALLSKTWKRRTDDASIMEKRTN